MADGNYLYGDSTAFPLDENFLETARAAAGTSVALLRADEIAEEERRLVAEAEQRTMVELIHLGKFARRVEDIYAHAADPLLIVVEVDPPEREDVRLEYAARGMRAAVLGVLAGIKKQIVAQVVRVVRAELADPAVRTLDVGERIDRLL